MLNMTNAQDFSEKKQTVQFTSTRQYKTKLRTSKNQQAFIEILSEE